MVNIELQTYIHTYIHNDITIRKNRCALNRFCSVFAERNETQKPSLVVFESLHRNVCMYVWPRKLGKYR